MTRAFTLLLVSFFFFMVCGCDGADPDTDNDGTPDRNDGCPLDPNKTEAGACGCGLADTDTDHDGTSDCHDGCPLDPDKTEAGACGCNAADPDQDGDGIADCIDNCPQAANPDQIDTDDDGIGDDCTIPFLMVSAGAFHSCAIRDDGSGRTLWCWGEGILGTLGDGGHDNKSVPTRVGTNTDWATVAAGAFHSCGIRNNESGRTLWCWGGDGGKSVPTQVGVYTDWLSVTAGYDHICGLRDDGSGASLWCWSGLGYESVPTQVGRDADWVSVAAGDYQSCGIRDDESGRTLWCWGGSSSANMPTQVGTDTDWVSVVAGYGHICGLRDEGSGRTLWCWGRNGYGQLGDGSTEGKDVPTQVGTDNDWITVAAGDHQSCGIRNGETGASLWCWGRNLHGQLGDGSTEDKRVPTQVGTDTDWVSVTMGGGIPISFWGRYWGGHSCGIRNNGSGPSLWCWGFNENGQLGDGIPLDPRRAGTNTDWISVAAGDHHNCGLRDDGTGPSLWCWGNNEDGQLGDNSTEEKDKPTPVGTDHDWVTVTAGDDHNCGLRDDGSGPSLWCWGSNEYGQLGNGGLEDKNVPTRAGTDTDWVSLDAGGQHSCGLRDDGSGPSLWCWGYNEYGQLGDGSTENRNAPTQVGTDTDWVSVAAGFGHTYGIRNDGSGPSLWCWGGSTAGEKSVPTQVGTDTDWVSVDAGFWHSCGIRNDGSGSSLWCWGYNDRGQLGDGSIEDKNVPTQVAADADWLTLSTRQCQTCGIRGDEANRTLWCWGSTNCAAPSDSQLVGYSLETEPTQIGTDTDWSTLSVGGPHICGIRDDGSGSSLWCRGEDWFGQLGDGVPHREEPNQVHW